MKILNLGLITILLAFLVLTGCGGSSNANSITSLTIEGTILDALGMPISGQRVYLTVDRVNGVIRGTSTTDPDGSYKFQVNETTLSLDLKTYGPSSVFYWVFFIDVSDFFANYVIFRSGDSGEIKYEKDIQKK